MKRVFTATCIAATFAVGLAAQSTGTAGTATAQDPQSGGQRGGGPRTVTGCLRAGDTAGTFMLTDVTMQGGRSGSGAGATAGGGTGTTAGGTGTTAGGTGTTAGGTATGSGATGGATAGAAGQAGGQGMAPASVMLTADASVDLKAHVGHKIEVTGTMAGGRGRGPDGGTGTTGTTAGTTAGTTVGTTAGGTTATGTGSASGTGTSGATATGQGGGRGPRNMAVTSVRMISESCS